MALAALTEVLFMGSRAADGSGFSFGIRIISSPVETSNACLEMHEMHRCIKLIKNYFTSLNNVYNTVAEQLIEILSKWLLSVPRAKPRGKNKTNTQFLQPQRGQQGQQVHGLLRRRTV